MRRFTLMALAAVLLLTAATPLLAARDGQTPQAYKGWKVTQPKAGGSAKAAWQNNQLWLGTATIRKLVRVTHVMGASDDTIRLFANQSATPRHTILLTDTSTAAGTPMANRWVKTKVDSTGSGLNPAASGDINNDGTADLFAARQGAAPYRIKRFYWTGTGWNTDTTVATVTGAINDIAVGDADNSGAADDVIFTNGQTVMRAHWNGASFDTTRIWTGDGNTCYGVAIGDFDASHAGNEIVAVTYAARAMKISFNGASWDTSTMYYNASAGFFEVAIGDFDASNPGNEVALGLNFGMATYGMVGELYGSGTTWTYQPLYLGATAVSDLAVGDFLDENAGNEIAMVSSSTAAPVRAVYGSGATWGNQVIYTPTGTSYGVVVGDINRFRANNDEVGFISTLAFREAEQYWPAHDLTVTAGGPASYPFVISQPESVWARIKNNGTGSEGAFNVNLNINGSVVATVPVAGLNVGDSADVYLPFTPGAEGALNFAIYHDLGTDEVPANDTLGTLASTNVTKRFQDWAFGAGTYAAQGFEYIASFPPAGWVRINNDGGTQNWGWFTGSNTQIHTGRSFTGSRYESATLTNDDWLVTGAVTVPRGYTDTVRLYSRAYSSLYPELIEVWAMNGQTAADTAALLWTQNSADTTYQVAKICLDGQRGKTINIGIRNHGLYEDYLFVDDISFARYDVPPTITGTNPADAATEIPFDQPVVIAFSEPVDQGTFVLTTSDPALNWIPVWNAGGDTVSLTHDPFAANTAYTITVNVANDLNGNPLAAGSVPNPFTFTSSTDVTAPVIALTVPADSTINVLLGQPVVIAFSEPIRAAGFAFTCAPDPGNLVVGWNATGDTATFTHDMLVPTTEYQFTVTAALDIPGNALTAGSVPNPFVFTAIADTIKPNIIWTSPSNGATKVAVTAPVVVAFSEAMDPASFVSVMDPFINGLNPVWNAAQDTVTLVQTVENFALNTAYKFSVTAAADLVGNPVAVLPDSIMFTTSNDSTAPYIVSTYPADGTIDVALNEPMVIVAFSEPMNTSSVNGYPSPDHNFSLSWNAAGDTMTLTSDTLFDYGTAYSIIAISGTDTSGNSLAGLPDTFVTFTTVANQAPVILLVDTLKETYDVTGPYIIKARIYDLMKAGVAAESLYYVVNRGSAFSAIGGTQIGGTDTFQFDIPGPIAAGSVVDYYLVAWDDHGAGAAIPYISYSFSVAYPYPPAGLIATTGQDGNVPLHWRAPYDSLTYFNPGSATAYLWSNYSGDIFTTRFTPNQYPCKLEQVTQLWRRYTTSDSLEVHVWPDNGNGLPDTTVNLIVPFKILPQNRPTWTVVNLSAYNLVINSGDFHVGFRCTQDSFPLGRTDDDGPGIRSIYYENASGSWYTMGYDLQHRAFVSYSTYSKSGLNLLSAANLKALPSRPASQSANDAGFKSYKYPANTGGIIAAAKNHAGYEVLRSNISGSGYASLGTATDTLYTDNTVTNDSTYYYVIRALYDRPSLPDTFSAYSNEASATPLGVEGQPGTVNYSFYLMPASPNPVKYSAEFRFGLAREGQTSLGIYNVLGQKVQTLVNGRLAAGNHSVKWNGCDQNGRKVSSGIYVYRLTAGDNSFTRRFTVIR